MGCASSSASKPKSRPKSNSRADNTRVEPPQRPKAAASSSNGQPPMNKQQSSSQTVEKKTSPTPPVPPNQSAAKSTSQQDKNFSGSPLPFAHIKDFIDWSDIRVKASTAEEAILGTGSFGTVVKATWLIRRYDGSITQEVDVAVKVLTRSSSNTSSDDEYYEIVRRAINEVVLLKDAESKIGSSDRIVKAYGVAKGALPRDITTLFNILDDDEGVGIVMRYEGGGSLESLLHSKRAKQRPPMSIREKIYILKGIAHGLAELHSVGIVHADIKPDNVLLSTDNPPQVRVADFGMSILQEQLNYTMLGASSLSATTHMRGTPVYCAPEMLINPYEEFDGTVAKSSRKTDMYAFGMLAWEVLSGERPFSDLRSEGVLCSRVHKGYRPPLEKLPVDTPSDIIGMIELCWDKDRAQRLSAIECLAILHYQYDLDSGKRFDVFLSHSKSMRPFLSHVAHSLTQLGYSVWFDQSEEHDVEANTNPSYVRQSSTNGISKSKIFLACVDKSYMQNYGCVNELKLARSLSPEKPVMVALLQSNPSNWCNDKFYHLCDFDRSQFMDLSNVAQDIWNQEEGPDTKVLQYLSQGMKPLIQFIDEQTKK